MEPARHRWGLGGGRVQQGGDEDGLQQAEHHQGQTQGKIDTGRKLGLPEGQRHQPGLYSSLPIPPWEAQPLLPSISPFPEPVPPVPLTLLFSRAGGAILMRGVPLAGSKSFIMSRKTL